MQADNRIFGSHQPLRQSEPSVRPLGYIAVGFAILALLLAPTYFFTLFTFLPALLAVVLGLLVRGAGAARAFGNAALLIAGPAIVVATCVILLWY